MQWHSRWEMFAELRVGIAGVCLCEVHMSDLVEGRGCKAVEPAFMEASIRAAFRHFKGPVCRSWEDLSAELEAE